MRLKLIGVLSLFSLLSACSTTENKPQPQVISQPEPEIVEQVLDAQGLYDKSTTLVGVDKIQLLYQARDYAINDKNWPLVITISDDLNQLNDTDQVQNSLYIAYAHNQLRDYSNAIDLLEKLNAHLTSPLHFYLHQSIYGSVYAAQLLPNRAVPFLIRASEVAVQQEIDNAYFDHQLWQELNKLNTQQLETLKSGSVIQQGWVDLALYSQLYIGDPTSLHSAMSNWQRRYPEHPASFALPEKVQTLMSVEPYQDQTVAIILPNGKSKNQALVSAVKNGIIAANQFTPHRTLHFIDASLSSQAISYRLTEITPDFVIGPLFKSNIEKLQAEQVLAPYPTLYLNTAKQSLVSADHYSFALKPEHEITQAIYHFINQGFQKPLLMVPGNKNGKRLVTHFEKVWAEYSETTPEIGYYTNNKDMQKQVKSLLEVEQSKKRIHEVSLLFKEKVESETRSRRDIDVIYLLGNDVQTRLLKPSFDVNISTFADRIPLYASSKAYAVNNSSQDKRDLAGLYFSQMPWMLPQKQSSTLLREDFDFLWPDQSSLTQQLFAMGYDALNLIPQLRQLHAIPGKSQQGLTGQLSLNEQGEVERMLAWAQFQNDKIHTVQLSVEKPKTLILRQAELNAQQAPLAQDDQYYGEVD